MLDGVGDQLGCHQDQDLSGGVRGSRPGGDRLPRPIRRPIIARQLDNTEFLMSGRYRVTIHVSS